jgi:hypothetical protein
MCPPRDFRQERKRSPVSKKHPTLAGQVCKKPRWFNDSLSSLKEERD